MEIQMPPPPPPPSAIFPLIHQEPLNLNNNRNLNDRSQLLIDIERGATLRKISNSQKGLNSRPSNETKKISSSNECNGIDSNNEDDPINPIKNQLQAELCSTLSRRQNGCTKKPNFIIPKNTTINAINNQLREMQNNSQTQPAPNGKITTEAIPAKESSGTSAKDKEEKPKLMISHGKPNFKISSNSLSSKLLLQKNEKPMDDELIGTLRRRLKSVETLDESDSIEKSQENVQTNQGNVTKIDISSVPKVPVSPPVFYKASVKNHNSVINQVSTTDNNNELKRTIRRLKSVELLEQINEKSVDEKTELNDIQKKIQKLKTVEINKNHSPTNRSPEPRSDELYKTETDYFQSSPVLPRRAQLYKTETDCFQSSPVLPRRAQLFKQQQNLVNPKITSPTIHHINHGTTNFKPKPMTSFSRDLQLTPNRYPEKIAVKKTLEPEPVFFSDIKFAINSNGEVVRS